MACIHCILLAVKTSALKNNPSATFAEGTNCGASKDLCNKRTSQEAMILLDKEPLLHDSQ
jgi:hypothetical protein